MDNTQIAHVFDEIADLLDLQGGNAFRIRSYRSAAQTVRGLSRRLEDMTAEGEDLSKLPNVGKSTAEKIGELLETGHCRRLDDLRQQVPSGLTDVMRVPQVGPRKAMQLHQELDVESLDDLRKVSENHKVRGLSGMGARTEENILKGLKTLETTSGRILLKEAAEHVETLRRHLDQIKLIKQWKIAGSFRRSRETIGDLDFLIQTKQRKKATDELLKLRDIGEVLRRGEERLTVRLTSGLQVDFRFFEPNSLGSALMYFTGSKAHNIALRKLAQERSWKLNEYGLFKGRQQLEGKNEKAVYKRLKLAWIPPEIREDHGEIAAAAQNKIPRLIEQKDLRGDLHCHTKATDGANTIREMAQAARDLGYDYLAITDHSQAVTVANGLTESRLRKHADEILEVGRSLKGFTIDTDAHKQSDLELIHYGVTHARRGWLTRSDVLNTVSASELRKRIKRK